MDDQSCARVVPFSLDSVASFAFSVQTKNPTHQKRALLLVKRGLRSSNSFFSSVVQFASISAGFGLGKTEDRTTAARNADDVFEEDATGNVT